MTGNETLREMLDERGVEWEDMSARLPTGMLWCTEWTSQNGEPCTAIEGADDIPDGKLSVQALLTPAQAIAATLGSGTCHIERYDTDVLLGEDYYRCTACHSEIFDNLGYRFCPYCGAKVVDE